MELCTTKGLYNSRPMEFFNEYSYFIHQRRHYENLFDNICTRKTVDNLERLSAGHQQIFAPIEEAHKHLAEARRAREKSLIMGDKLAKYALKKKLTPGVVNGYALLGRPERKYNTLDKDQQAWFLKLINVDELKEHILKDPALIKQSNARKLKIAKGAIDLVNKSLNHREDVFYHLDLMEELIDKSNKV